jgi:hypothetical protein
LRARSAAVGNIVDGAAQRVYLAHRHALVHGQDAHSRME